MTIETEAPGAGVPASADDLAAGLRAADEAGSRVRVRGAGTKLAWARPDSEPAVEISTTGLDRIVEHNAGDLTAVLEAGVPLARAQATFAEAGQMLALDPPDSGGATIGGLVSSGDSGPLRTRYGSVRDLVVGVRVALADGTLAKSGGKVIKNVAGYDLAKLFAGAFGWLGAIVEVSVRLHPLSAATTTALARSSDPQALARGASALSHARLEQLGLDVRWAHGEGTVLSRYGGASPGPQAEAGQRVLREAGLETELHEDDDALWEAQREGQRSPSGLVVKVAAVQTDLPDLLRIAGRHSATLVGRAGLAVHWLRLEEGNPEALVDELRARYPATVLDRPAGLDVARDAPLDPGVEALVSRVKERFDPRGTLI